MTLTKRMTIYLSQFSNTIVIHAIILFSAFIKTYCLGQRLKLAVEQHQTTRQARERTIVLEGFLFMLFSLCE